MMSTENVDETDRYETILVLVKKNIDIVQRGSTSNGIYPDSIYTTLFPAFSLSLFTIEHDDSGKKWHDRRIRRANLRWSARKSISFRDLLSDSRLAAELID